jgi:membrane protease YdiL (CAAX protease family)
MGSVIKSMLQVVGMEMADFSTCVLKMTNIEQSDDKAASISLNRTELIALSSFMLTVLYFPVTLIWLGIIPFSYRFHALAILLTAWLVYTVMRKHGLRDLGFRCDNLKGSLFWNCILCAVGGCVIYVTYLAGYLRTSPIAIWPSSYIIYVFILVPIQELVFRSILFAEMKKINISDYRWLIAVSTVSFCFLHIIYKHPIILVITFCSGLIWGIIYNRYPNIWGVTMSHALLGSMAIAFGLI